MKTPKRNTNVTTQTVPRRPTVPSLFRSSAPSLMITGRGRGVRLPVPLNALRVGVGGNGTGGEIVSFLHLQR